MSTAIKSSGDKLHVVFVWVYVGQLLSLYSRFYKVIMLESTNATGEGTNTNVFLDV
jgi:hypothetical protein